MTQKELRKALVRLKVETGSLACLGCGYEHNCSTQGCRILREAEMLISDVAPVRHGHWVCKRGTFECSECKWEALEKTEWYGSWDVSYEQVLSDFCPHCGAIMDGGIEDATD